MARLKLCIAVLVFGLGCGPTVEKKNPGNNGGGNNETNNGATNNGATNNGATNNGATNNGATNNGATNNIDSCVVVEPNSLDFGTVEVGQAATDSFSLENCSDSVPLEFIGVGDDGPFSVLFPAVATLAPGAKLAIPVAYAPPDAGSHQGTVSVTTSVGRLDVSVKGTATSDVVTCPTAVARVRAIGGTFAENAPIPVGETAEFSAAASAGEGAQIVSYEWTMVAKPAGSQAMFAPSANVENPTIVLDVPGDYVAEVLVFDSRGEQSCTAARATATAVTDGQGALHISLTWDTDKSDLDLHYLHPNGSWDMDPWDCSWRNKAPSWGAPGAFDDPSMDIDDVSGFGPENINHSGLESVVYHVGVHAYALHGAPATSPTTRIFIDGNLVLQDFGNPMTEGQFRYVGTLDGGNNSVGTVGTVTTGFP